MSGMVTGLGLGVGQPRTYLESSSGDHYLHYQSWNSSFPSRCWVRDVLFRLLPLLPEKSVPGRISFTLLSCKLNCCTGTSEWKSLHHSCKRDWKSECLAFTLVKWDSNIDFPCLRKLSKSFWALNYDGFFFFYSLQNFQKIKNN